jgi:Flp pilus assembly protein TadD
LREIAQESLSIMPDRIVTSLRRAVAPVLVAALATCTAACSSGKTDTRWKAENAYGSEMAKKGFWREALFRYEKAAREKPGDAQIQNNLAVAYESTGDTARALAAYKRALELAPQDAKIKRNYARFAEYYTSVQRASSLPAPSSSAPAVASAVTPAATPVPSATPVPAPAPGEVPAPRVTPPFVQPPASLPTPAPGPGGRS